MHYLSSEHRDIIELLENSGIHNVLLTKKKGWIHLRLNNQDFSYHRQKVSNLQDGQFVDSYLYYIKFENQKSELDDWDSVLQMLEGWIHSLNQKD